MGILDYVRVVEVPRVVRGSCDIRIIRAIGFINVIRALRVQCSWRT